MKRLTSAIFGAAAMLSIAAALPGRADTTPPPPPLDSLFGGDFSLVDHTGKRRTAADFKGRFMLVYFGYTYCPDICPTSLDAMTRAVESLGAESANVQPVFISVDPARDTPMVLNEYVNAFSDRLVGLTGTEQEVRVATKAFRVHRRKVIASTGASSNAENSEDYLVDHSSLTLLMSPEGRFVTLFPFNTGADVIASRLKRHLGAATTN